MIPTVSAVIIDILELYHEFVIMDTF